MPVMKVGNEYLGQSSAINYYIASELFLMGSSNLEAAKIINIEESLKEIHAAFHSMVPYGQCPTEEQLDEWYTGGATDIDGPANPAGKDRRYAIWYFGRIEKLLGTSGFAVGSQLSLADVLIIISLRNLSHLNKRIPVYLLGNVVPLEIKIVLMPFLNLIHE
jgi:glutathione S-transferase